MHLHELLSSLTHVPTYFLAIQFFCFILMVVFFILSLKFDKDEETNKTVASMIALFVSLLAGISFLVYPQNSIESAIENAKITRSGDKIHIESKSEFLKSADLDIVSEKDGYIKVEFKNKIYRIEDLSKKGN